MTKTDIVVTPKQLEEMRHALGLDYKKQPTEITSTPHGPIRRGQTS